jgi:peptidoglycan/xylan/chitin deacetylase (PgdA/CDA1 family)
MQMDGFEIGSHTRSHFDCRSQDAAALENEIVGSREELETSLGERIEFFSFPFGLPENISPQAAEIAGRTYSYVLSAFGSDNAPPLDDDVKHLKRWCHPNRLWDLELQIQGALEPAPTFELPVVPFGTDAPKTITVDPVPNPL